MEQQPSAEKYIFMGQFTQISNSICIGIDKKFSKDKTFEHENFKPGQWNIWLYKKNKHVNEVVLMHCADDIVKHPGAMEYNNDDHKWIKSKRFMGVVYIISDATKMTITSKILDPSDICVLDNGLVIKNVSNKVKYSSVSIIEEKEVVIGLKIRYVTKLRKKI